MFAPAITPSIEVTIGRETRLYYAFITTAPTTLDAPATVTLHTAPLSDVSGMAADPIARPAAAGTVELGNANTRSAPSAEDGYGNDAPAEIRERFPQPLGNLAQHARFPHSHSRLSYFDQEEQRQQTRTTPCHVSQGGARLSIG